MKTLEQLKQEVLAIVTEYVDTFRQAPTVRQIMDHLDARSVSQVHRALKELCNEGKLYEPGPGKYRGYTPTEDTMGDWEASQRQVERQVVRFLLGRIRATDLRTEWIEVIKQIETGKHLFDPRDEIVEVPRSMLPLDTDRLIALRVSGDSLQDSFVTDGDIIILRLAAPGYRPAQGEIVAAGSLTTNEVTLKHYYELQDCVELRPANANYEPIRLAKEDIYIIGTLVMRWHLWEDNGAAWPWEKQREGFYKLFSHVYRKNILFGHILIRNEVTMDQLLGWAKDATWLERFVKRLAKRFLPVMKPQAVGCNTLVIDLYYGLTQPSLGSKEAVAARLQMTPDEVHACLLAFVTYLRTQPAMSKMESLVLEAATSVTART